MGGRSRTRLEKAPQYVDEHLAFSLVRGRTVLVVEDDPRDLARTTRTLSKIGLQVVAASCAEDGIALAKSGSKGIDTALIDLLLPGMDGFEACKVLRAAPHLCCAVPYTGTLLASTHVGAVTRCGDGCVLHKPLQETTSAQVLAAAIVFTTAWQLEARTDLSTPALRRMSRWSVKRRETVALQVAGLTIAGIAALRGVSTNSVKDMLSSARADLGLPMGGRLPSYLALEVLTPANASRGH